jgi:hypothetical protein
MANNTHILLEKVVVTGNGYSTVTFSNLPQTGYTDLVIYASIRTNYTTSNYDYLGLRVNNDTAYANYPVQLDMYGLNSALGFETYAQGNTTQFGQLAFVGGSTTSTNGTNGFSNHTIYIPNYTSTSLPKVFFAQGGTEGPSTTGVITSNSSMIWNSTASISTLTFIPISGGAFNPGTSFSVYGVSNFTTGAGKAPKAVGGQSIETDGTYWYHAFTTIGSQTFTPISYGMSADVLVVAGGGSGGSRVGGGGGAGGVLSWFAQSLVYNTPYTVTVGAGGAAVVDTTSGSRGVAGNIGSNSQFSSLTASVGGGGGGAYTQIPATSGGSGGGAGGYNSSASATGAASSASGQGFAGGNGVSAAAGGGGGAGSVGVTGITSVNQGGNGGAGTNAFSSWLSPLGLGVSGGYVAGGGGGAADTNAGAGGSGGGGAGTSGSTQPAASGVASTGSGGGGVRDSGDTGNFLSGAGGSGLVIVRYLAS